MRLKHQFRVRERRLEFVLETGLQGASSVKLTKNYRSTWEIMRFALAISPNPELEAMKRHGPVPEVVTCKRCPQMEDRIIEDIAALQASDHQNLAIITKTQKQAARVHKSLASKGAELQLLDADNEGFSSDVLVCSTQLAKGLEFDRVIVADASADNY